MARRTNNNVTLDLRVLNGLIDNRERNVANGIAKAAFTLEANTKIQIQQMDAIDTGAMLNSTQTSLKGGNNDAASAAARARRPDVQLTDLPTPPDSQTAYVGPTVEYAWDVHFGTNSMAGRPFLLEAVNQTADDFRRIMGEAVTGDN